MGLMEMLRLVMQDALGKFDISRKQILLSDEYRFVCKEAERIENERNAHAQAAELLIGITQRTVEENEQLAPLAQEYQKMIRILKDHLMTSSPEWTKMSPSEKLDKYLEGNNNLIAIERTNARNAKKYASTISKQAKREVKDMQRLVRDIREGSVPKEVLEAIIQKVPKATLVLDPTFLITSYNAPAESHPHFKLAKNMDYKRLFSIAEGFNQFTGEMKRLRQGQSYESYTLLGDHGKKGDYVSTASPIFAQAKLLVYDVSIRPETKMEWAKRKLSLTRLVAPELEPNALPEQE